MQPEPRRLAAILAADVAGYSRLMAADEAGTLARLKSLKAEVIAPAIARFQGRVVGSAGDSLLIEFSSALNAVQCAIQTQAALSEHNAGLPADRRMEFRMGINLGDVIPEGDTIHGDGVNVAARLEKLAEPGGVCIGRGVYEQVRGRLAAGILDLGEQRLHNMPEPVRVYRVLASGAAEAPSAYATLALPDKPSIAVLPFQNMSGEGEQDYFADGVVEEIIIALARFHGLFVIARNSSFIYKGRNVDAKQVGRELGVRYLLEGSVRKAGTKLRITGQLIDTASGGHLWADRFDGELADVFDLQDQVTSSVVGAIAPKLEQVEIERAKRKPTESLDAYDYYLRGLAGIHQWSREANTEALANFNRAIALDPNFAAAYGLAARCHARRKAGGWSDPGESIAEVERLARRAVELGPDDAVALCTAGFALAYVVGELDEGATLIAKALKLNPNLAWAWLYSGWIAVWSGEPERAIEDLEHAMRLSPHDLEVFNMQTALAHAHYVAGRYAEAVSWAETTMRHGPTHYMALRIMAASSAMLGRDEEARKAMARMRAFDPDLRISTLALPYRRADDLARLQEGLRKAGLPE